MINSQDESVALSSRLHRTCLAAFCFVLNLLFGSTHFRNAGLGVPLSLGLGLLFCLPLEFLSHKASLLSFMVRKFPFSFELGLNSEDVRWHDEGTVQGRIYSVPELILGAFARFVLMRP